MGHHEPLLGSLLHSWLSHLTFSFLLSFFVDLLVAIVFPVVAGLVLGVWSLLWHKVRGAYVAMALGDPAPDPWSSHKSRKTLRRRLASVFRWRAPCGSRSVQR